MPQVIISLPNAIFPILSHFLNFQPNEEAPQVQPPSPPPPPPPQPQTQQPSRTPRRAYVRSHRRLSQSQTTPRHRLSRQNLRNRRGNQRSRDYSLSLDEIPHEELYPKDNREEDIATSSAHIPSLSLDTSLLPLEERIKEERTKDDYLSSPILDSTSSGDSTSIEEGGDDTESDSEQYTTSPVPFVERDSEHDGDEETERERRRRRRRGDRGERIERSERNEEAEVEGERERERTIETGENENQNRQENIMNNIPQAEERDTGDTEDTGDNGRLFIGNGWWFLAILLFVQLYQSGGLLFLCMLLLYVCFNSSALITYRSRSWQYKIAFLGAATISLLGTIIFVYWKFSEERLWLYLIFIPSHFNFSVTRALWTVWINEFVVVFVTIVLKHYLIIACASFRIVGQSTKKKILALMEHVSKLYRSTIPIPVWIFYLYHAFGEDDDIFKFKGLAFSGVWWVVLLLFSRYIYFVAVNIRFLGRELSKIIEHKTPEELCKKATIEEIKKYAEECAICRDDLGSRSPLTLPCSHVFCSECIYQWFDKHPSCPTCRSKIGGEDTFEESSGNTNIHLQENGIGLSVSFDDL